MSPALVALRPPRKLRASFTLLPIDRALTMDFGGQVYVYAHPSFWIAKGITPDCILGVGAVGEDMAAAFAEYGCWDLPVCERFDYDGFAKKQRVAQKANEAREGGVLSLFG